MTGGATERVRTVSCASIAAAYERDYQIDVSPYFEGHETLDVHRCRDTGYEFYHPFIEGDSGFYARLQEFDWFYKTDKWEYRSALARLRPGSAVLDVGCGAGAFLRMAAEAGHRASGLELNERSAAAARAEGLDVRSELIGAHAARPQAKYDAVVSFQVLEHVADVGGFLTDCLDVLRPGGLLIIGVPNNAGFLGMAKDMPLNMPPHHLGLWTPDSLSAAMTGLGLVTRAIANEPLEETAWYASVMENRYVGGGIRRKLYHRLGADAIFRRYVEENAASIAGHSVLGVFEKPSAPVDLIPAL